MQKIIETFEITKLFSKEKNYKALFRFNRHEDILAVDSVSLEIHKGELFGLLGSNGAGKTTLVRMLSTLILPNSGTATVGGKDILTKAGEIKRMIGLVDCQDRSFFWRLSGRQNLEFFAALHGIYGANARQRVNELLDLVGMQAHADQRFSGYSTGMRQKLAVARGLLALPPIIFMDEPTRSLDPVSAHELRQFIREKLVNEMGATVLLVTHHLEEAEQLCDRLAIMNNGRILACGSTDEIKRHVSARQKYQFTIGNQQKNVELQLKKIPGVVEAYIEMARSDTNRLIITMNNGEKTLPEVMRILVNQNVEIQQCKAQSLSLEEVFIQLVKGNP